MRDKFAFGEIIAERSTCFVDYLAVSGMSFYDFPLAAAMREAFAFAGDLRILKDASSHERALHGHQAVTFVRNHDIERGQISDRGIEESPCRALYGIGWDEKTNTLNRTDVELAQAFIFGREDGFPYVFASMNTLPEWEQNDRYDDPLIVAGIRFHNLCLPSRCRTIRRPEI